MNFELCFSPMNGQCKFSEAAILVGICYYVQGIKAGKNLFNLHIVRNRTYLHEIQYFIFWVLHGIICEFVGTYVD